MNKVFLIFGCHCHQPLGNFEKVIEKIYNDSYLAFLETVSRHPKIKIVLHYSGVLLDWIGEKHPEFFELIRKLIQRGQVEILTGSYYEAILPCIPERDQIEQIKRLTKFISKTFPASPQGIWLAERVWEPKLAKTLPAAGVKFALVDDFHFQAVGLKESQVLGYFNVEEEGSFLSLFPISEQLRYSTPFKKVDNTINYLRHMSELKENPLLVIVDDCEKFGSWPGTKKWVYKDGWLEDFLRALEDNSQWIETLTCSEYIQKFPPIGLVYLPVGAYFEMGEWCLSAERAPEYQSLIKKLEEEGLLEIYKGFLKGGIWRNFFIKYPESNQLHKKMLALSKSIHRFEDDQENSPQRTRYLDLARTELLKSQCNDGYWHGLFGGLYFPHLRDAMYRHLIQGEKHIDKIIHQRKKKWCDTEIIDLDGDGLPEIILSNPWLKAYFDPGEGGILFELDYKPKNFNLINTLARRFEHYHRTISEGLKKEKTQPEEKNVSAHDLDKSADVERLKELLVYDRHRKACLVDHILDKWVDITQFSSVNFSEQGDFVNHPYSYTIEKEKKSVKLTLRRRGFFKQDGIFPVEIIKQIRMMNNESSLDINYGLINCSNKPLELTFGVELNFSMLTGRSPEVILSFIGEGKKNYKMATSGTKRGIKGVKIRNKIENFSLSLDIDKEPTLWWFPVETISQSEKRFDLTYQSTVIMPKWKINLPGGRKWTARIRLSVSPI